MKLSVDLPKRKSGILMALSSLPSNHGIGTLGAEAYRFIDMLSDTNQTYWQLLPLVPLGAGNSPYKSPSCFAGEPLYIDLDFLARDGLLSYSDILNADFPENADFDLVRRYKTPLIRKAAENFDTDNDDYKIFLAENEFWLKPYAVFMTALKVFGTSHILGLPDYIKRRTGEDYRDFLDFNKREIELFGIIQYFFYAQYFELKRYAESKSILLIGDIPFYVSEDSADVWANPENFLVGEDLKPKLVAGVPPDYFSEKGQLWGNPIYDFDFQKKDDYDWWIKRLSFSFRLFDVVRVDHFRAFADYYCIKAGSLDAMSGEWKTGVGLDFWKTAHEKIPGMAIIAEDLGVMTEAVTNLVKDTGFPNMRVIQFAFSGDPNNPHLPSNYPENCVCYTGTHDNNTTLGFIENALPFELEMINRLFPETEDFPPPLNLIAGAMNSPADTVIVPIQDYLMLGEEYRMNIPGVPSGNWAFRVKKDYITEELKERIKKIARLTGRE